MSSILPQIEQLVEIPALHEMYAAKLLALLIKELHSLDEFPVGVYGDNKGSVIGFNENEFENVLLELRCRRYKFSIKVTSPGDGFDSSNFIYNIPIDSEMYNTIPEKLRGIMEDVANNFSPITYRPNRFK